MLHVIGRHPGLGGVDWSVVRLKRTFTILHAQYPVGHAGGAIDVTDKTHRAEGTTDWTTRKALRDRPPEVKLRHELVL